MGRSGKHWNRMWMHWQLGCWRRLDASGAGRRCSWWARRCLDVRINGQLSPVNMLAVVFLMESSTFFIEEDGYTKENNSLVLFFLSRLLNAETWKTVWSFVGIKQCVQDRNEYDWNIRTVKWQKNVQSIS